MSDTTTESMQALLQQWSEQDTQALLKVFDQITLRLRTHGWCVIEQAMPNVLTDALIDTVNALDHTHFKSAGIGRNQLSQKQKSIRGDSIYWLEHRNNSPAQSAWLNVMEVLKTAINRQLFMGLFSYESHFAHYRKGDFYKKHRDAFKGKSNRMVSSVFYLNNHNDQMGGELVIYDEHDDTKEIARVTPKAGTLVIFLSESFAHEVLSAKNDRYSIAGWFRINSSNSAQIDPAD